MTTKNNKKSAAIVSSADLNNTANQLNPNNKAYWKSRGVDERPENWTKLIVELKKTK
jgi:hypothetical protein